MSILRSPKGNIVSLLLLQIIYKYYGGSCFKILGKKSNSAGCIRTYRYSLLHSVRNGLG